MSLRRATVRLARRRLVRSLGYRGDDPGRAFALGLIGIAIGEAVFTRLAVTYVTTQGSSPDLIHAIMPTIALLLAYTLAGPALLLAESARGQGSSLERVLEALPVSRSEARLQLWVPPLTVALACVALMVPPTVAALIAADVAAGAAVLAVTATLVVAAATAAVLLMVAKVVLRGPRWASVHYPIALLGYIVGLVLVIASVLRMDGRLTLVDRLLGLPRVLQDVQELGTLTAGTAALTLLCAAGCLYAGLAVAARVGSGDGGDDPLIRWPMSDRPHLVAADLLYVLRSPGLVSNVIAAVGVSVALVVVLFRMSPTMAQQVVTPFLTVVPTMAGLSVRMLRGMFRIVNPPQQFAGVSMADWVRRLNLVAVALFGVVVLPAAAIVFRRDLLGALDLGVCIQAFVTSLAISLLLAWALPGDALDPAGQVVATLVYLVVVSMALWAVHAVAGFSSVAAVVLAGALLATVLWSSPRIERARWQPTGRQQDTTIVAREQVSHG